MVINGNCTSRSAALLPPPPTFFVTNKRREDKCSTCSVLQLTHALWLLVYRREVEPNCAFCFFVFLYLHARTHTHS